MILALALTTFAFQPGYSATCHQVLTQHHLLKDGFDILRRPQEESFSVAIEALKRIFPRRKDREVRLLTSEMSASLDPALVSWAEWGARHLSANLGRVVAWEKLILIREAEGYRRHHVHTDPAVATMILTFSGADHEGTWVAPNGSVKTGSPFLWFTHLLARRASRNFRHWNGEFVRRQDLVQVDSGNEVLFVLGHLARNVLGPDAPVGFHTAPFEPRRQERYVGAFTYEFK